MVAFATDERQKLIFTSLEDKGHKTDAFGLLAKRRYEAVSRRAGQTLQDFFATETMAFADAVRSGVTIDDDRHAYHMLIHSGLTHGQINHVHAFVFDPDVPSLTPIKCTKRR